MNILIFTFGGHQLGMGHIYRMLNLAKELKKKGHMVSFLMPCISEGIEKVQKEGFFPIQIPFSHFKEPDEYLNKVPLVLDCIIVDALNVPAPIMLIFKNRTKFLITFDNTGTGRGLADFLVNILYKQKPFFLDSGKEVQDFDYLLLNPQFAEYNKEPKEIQKIVKNILITQGGADSHGIIPQLIKEIKNLPNITIHILTGPAFRDNCLLDGIMEIKKGNIIIHNDMEQPWNLYYSMDLAITGGGMTLFELLCIGVPCIALTGEQKEIETIDLLDSMGLLYNFGLYKIGGKKNINRYIEEIINNYPLRKSLMEQGKKIIDGKGCERIAKVIEQGIYQ